MELRGDDILVITEQHWDAPKRIAHKMPLAWAKAGNRVLWISGAPFPVAEWAPGAKIAASLGGKLEQPHERIWVGYAPPALPLMHRGGVLGNSLRACQRPAMLRRIRGYLRKLSMDPKLVVLMQLPVRHDLLKAFPHTKQIYYSHDLFGYGAAGELAYREEARCCQTVDQIWTTSESQRDRLIKQNRRTHCIPHAVDEAWWDKNRYTSPTEYDSIPHPRVVFTGVVQTEKVDLKLLVGVAESRPNMNFILIGPQQVRPEEQGIAARAYGLPNIHWLGHRSVDELPGYIQGADALILPYRLDDPNTPFIGKSLKLLEYMISGRPVIMTPYSAIEPAVKELVTVADGCVEWASALDQVVNRWTSDMASRCERYARSNTYEVRLDRQRELLTRVRREEAC